MAQRLVIGVVGPRDLVPSVAATVEEEAELTALRLPYRSEDETLAVVTDHRDDVDGWLFTGVVPHHLARQAGVLTQPAEHVSYSGLTLLAALFRLSRADREVTRFSIDTLPEAEVVETLREAGLPDSGVRVCPFREGQRSEDVIAFHRTAQRRDGARTAITCLRSTYDALDGELEVVRLVPSQRDTRDAVQSLVLRASDRRHSDAQVAIGILELDGSDQRDGYESVAAESFAAEQARALGGTASRLPDGRYLVVSTRGLLERATASFTTAPPLQPPPGQGHAHLGLGLGRSAAEATALAERAVVRARAAGQVATVLSRLHGDDLFLGASTGAAQAGTEDLGLLSIRIGLSRGTLQSMRALVRDREDASVTASDIAVGFGIQERSARRLLKRLERAGIAVPSGRQLEGRSGRPRVVYRVDL
jgi:hypothetical protein